LLTDLARYKKADILRGSVIKK